MPKIKFKGERTASTLKIIAGLVLFLVTIHTNFVIGATLIIAAVTAAAIYELEKALGVTSKAFMGITMTVGALESCYMGYATSVADAFVPSAIQLFIIGSFYAIFLLILAVIFHEKIRYSHVVAAFFGTLTIPYALSGFVMLNNISTFCPKMSHYDGIYLVWAAFIASWVTDSFAFLVGRKFGKHKLCPKISPKKSVEGAVGGVVLTALFMLVVTLGYDFVAKKCGHDVFLYESNIKYLFVALFSMVLSIVSMFGDLAASVLKRNVGIKDFSNLLPGHGGIMDRFDSCFFVVPCLLGLVILVMGH